MFRRAAVAEGQPVAVAERPTGERIVERGGTVNGSGESIRARRAAERDVAAGRGGWGRRRNRREVVAARGAEAVGTGVLAIGRLVRLIASLIALVIAAGIALIALDANSTNSVVSTVHDAARSLVGPFDGMFSMSSHKLAIAVNWGIALVVYLVVGSLIARMIERLGAGARSRAALD